MNSNINKHKIIYKKYQKIDNNKCILFDENEYSISSTHSEIHNIFILKWNVNNKFKNDCIRIYNILLDINIPSCYAQVISEYAATQYLRCIKCFIKYGFIECHLDYNYINNATAVCDENENIRYYLDTETSRITECDKYNKYDENMEILCVKCGSQWMCSHC
eukprot:361979_1